MLLPEKTESVLLINGRPIKEASPESLWRKNNEAAILDFTVPQKTYRSLVGIGIGFRQGDIIELYVGLGTAQQRIFYGYLPATLSDHDLDESNSLLHITASDFIGQFADRHITLGDSSSSFLNPIGQEIGGFVASLVQTVIDSQIGVAPAFSMQGIKGTNPSQVVTADNALLGSATAKSFVDSYTQLAFDDSSYPDAPLLYEYHQRDQYFIWRKQTSLIPGKESFILTLGKDAILSGIVSTKPIYTDAIAIGKTSDARWTQSDRDSARRWGGRRFWAGIQTQSSFQSDAYADAVRQVELFKNERISFGLTTMREPFLLYPGDLVRIDSGESVGIASIKYRVAEVKTRFFPAIRTDIVVGDQARLLSDYF